LTKDAITEETLKLNALQAANAKVQTTIESLKTITTSMAVKKDAGCGKIAGSYIRN